MSNSKVSITGKQLLIVFFMGLAFAVVYATPFVQYVFYDDLAGALHATNTQLGFLIAIFGIGNLLAPFGGALSDKFNTKKVYLLGMFITCALNFLLAMNMSYTLSLIHISFRTSHLLIAFLGQWWMHNPHSLQRSLFTVTFIINPPVNILCSAV